jgi:hypothetical protein
MMASSMNMTEHDPTTVLRRSVYGLLIALGLGAVLGRILAVDAVDRTGLDKYLRQKPSVHKRESLRRPFLSANDRSRWATVRALVEPDLRVPEAPYAIDNVLRQPNWDTIDKVYHDGHYFSSKPPLFATLLAGPYWLIYHATGMTLGSHPFAVGRIMLITLNGTALLVYFLALAWLVERLGRSDWGRIFVMAAAVFATFLSTFAVTLNNHLPAAACAAVTLYAAVRVWLDDQRHWRYFALAGLFGGLLVAEELPAAALVAPLTLALLWKAPRATLRAYLPPLAAVAVLFIATNWLAHHHWSLPYMHRNAGDSWYHYPGSYWNRPQATDLGEPSRAVYAANVLVGHHGIFSLTPVWLLSVAGLIAWLRRGTAPAVRQLALLVAGVSLVCVTFYLLRPLSDRNYGGASSGFRWVFWLTPLWLVGMLPAADFLARRRWTRALGMLLLAFSAVSVAYPTWNPWTSPWLMDFVQYLKG